MLVGLSVYTIARGWQAVQCVAFVCGTGAVLPKGPVSEGLVEPSKALRKLTITCGLVTRGLGPFSLKDSSPAL